MALPRRRRVFTPGEYLVLERASSYKSEYVNGEIFAMAGAGRAHITITMNASALLWYQLKGSGCRVFGSDMRVAVDAQAMYTYPDVSVVCGEPVCLDQPSEDNLTNPRMIFEVLSPSTEDYDRGEKFEKYKQIATLTDYVLLAQDQPRAEHFRRELSGDWTCREYVGLDAKLGLESIGCVLPLAEIYDGVGF